MRTRVVVIAVGLVVGMSSVQTPAASSKLPRRPTVVAVDTPVGLQGVAGAGANVVVSFRLFDRRRRRADVEVEYGYDLNGDGRITDGTERYYDGTLGYPNEWRPATEDRLDPRDTRRRTKPQLFESGVEDGAAHAFVWASRQDFRSDVILRSDFRLSLQGRLVPDPDNPGWFLPALSPDGSPVFAGVRLRARAFRRVGRRRLLATPWVSTAAFDLDDDHHPSMTIDAIATDAASPDIVLVNWTAFDADSEDLNGNGVLDVAEGEDLNGDGVLNDERLGVAFDCHVVMDDEDPSTMTQAQLAGLYWLPCARKAGVGDTDSLDSHPGLAPPTSGDLSGVGSAPFPVGRQWTFAWDWYKAVGTPNRPFILRATPFDLKRRRGAAVYWTTPVRPGQ